tara:strand:+ start:4758 stop:4964 length:207 start_codon:yes stop_codon:yes gene_type:complete
MLRNFINSFTSTAPKLGRWEHRIKKSQKEIKFILNNSDHCGDQICGNPKVVKELIESNLKNNKTNKTN